MHSFISRAGELAFREDADHFSGLEGLNGLGQGFPGIPGGNGEAVEEFQNPAEPADGYEFLRHDEADGRGGYIFLQSIYYGLQLNKVCRKIKLKYKFQYDINAILSDLIYARVLEPTSKRSSFKLASEFLEKPSYELHDVYRALDILGNECDLIQSELYKNSNFLMNRNDQVLYYDCSNYYFEIEQVPDISCIVRKFRCGIVI